MIMHTSTAENGARWVEGEIDGIRLGAYVEPDGSITMNDHDTWRVEHDLEAADVDPEGERGQNLVERWKAAVKEWCLDRPDPKAWRTRMGWTQTELAERLDPPSTQTMISRYESGGRRIPAGFWLALMWLERGETK